MSRTLAWKLLGLLLLPVIAGGLAPAMAQEGSDFDTLLVQIQVLERYHTRAEVVGMLFRIYEPEAWWNDAAPGTVIYQPDLANHRLRIASCEAAPLSQQCFEETRALQTILYLGECPLDIGCFNTTAKRLTVPGRTPVNVGHVFAGLSEELFPEVSTLFTVGSVALGFKALDSRARTYVGDMGAVLWTSVADPRFLAASTEDERFDVMNEVYARGMFYKYDLFADIDSYQIRELLRDDPSLTISNALGWYYLSSNLEYPHRFGGFRADELRVEVDADGNVTGYDEARLEDIYKSIVSYGFAIRASDAGNRNNLCKALNLDSRLCQLLFGTGGQDQWNINYYALFATGGFYDTILCFEAEERGLKTCEMPPGPPDTSPATTFQVFRSGQPLQNPLQVRPGESFIASWTSSGAASCRAYHQTPRGIFAAPWSGDLGTSGSQTLSLTEPGTHLLTLDCYSPDDLFTTRKVWEVRVAAADIDLAFVIDTTGSMWDDIANVKTAATQIVDAIFAGGGDPRVAVADYRDFPYSPWGGAGDYPFHVVTPFSRTASTVRSGLQSLVIGNGADWPESVYSGLMGSIQALPDGAGARLGFWRPFASKFIVVLGDAPPHDPEPYTGYRLADVLAAAAAGGNTGASPATLVKAAAQSPEPIHIHGIVVGGDTAARNSFRLLAEGSGGKLFTAANASEVVAAILGAIGETGPGNRPPDVSGATASRSQLWPPNQQMVAVRIQNVIDPDGDPVTVRVSGITSDEPVRDSQGDRFAPDASGAGTAEAALRAERSGKENSRVYRISFEASDGKGGVAAGSVLVCVPHDQGVNTACVDDGQLYDATAQ